MVYDFETAIYFFDAGVAEDLRAGARPKLENRSTPALRFLRIDSAQPAQAAKSLVSLTEQLIQTAVADYKNMPGHAPSLSVERLRKRFLRKAVTSKGNQWRTPATSFISYFVEMRHKTVLIQISPGRGTREPYFLHLFKGRYC